MKNNNDKFVSFEEDFEVFKKDYEKDLKKMRLYSSGIGTWLVYLMLAGMFIVLIMPIFLDDDTSKRYFKTEKVFFEDNEKNVEFSIDGKHIEISKKSIASIEYKIQKDTDKSYKDDEDDMELVIYIILNSGIIYQIESKYYGEGGDYLEIIDDLI